MPTYPPEQLRAAYEYLGSELSQTNEGCKILGDLRSAFSMYVGSVARLAARGSQSAPELTENYYNAALAQFRQAKNFLSGRNSDISCLLEEEDFIKNLAGEVVGYCMEHRKV